MSRSRILAWALLVAALPAAALAADPPQWETVRVLRWGAGAERVGLSSGGEDERVYGPHGVALGVDGAVAVIDRVGGRALVLGDEGELAAIPLPGRPGPAALLADGTLAVADEAAPRRVTRVDARGATVEVLESPRWAMPPVRLLAGDDGDGRVRLAGLDAFQLRVPLTPYAPEPRALERGVPSADGVAAAWVVRDGDTVTLHRPDGAAKLDALAAAGLTGDGWRPGAVEVLAVDAAGAVLAVEAVRDGDDGLLETARAVLWVDADGTPGDALALPAPGPVAIPDDLAATADGAVVLLIGDPAGCRVLIGRVGPAEAGR